MEMGVSRRCLGRIADGLRDLQDASPRDCPPESRRSRKVHCPGSWLHRRARETWWDNGNHHAVIWWDSGWTGNMHREASLSLEMGPLHTPLPTVRTTSMRNWTKSTFGTRTAGCRPVLTWTPVILWWSILERRTCSKPSPKREVLLGL